MTRCLTIAALIALTAVRGQAQTSSPSYRFFADAGAGVDLDPGTYNAYDYSTRPAGLIAIGAATPGQWNIRFETTVPAPHRTDVGRYELGPRGTAFNTAGAVEHQVVTYSFLVGRSFAAGRRIAITPVAGFSAADHVDHERLTTTIRTATGDASTQPSHTDRHELLSTFSMGAEVAIAASARIAIVPQFRVHHFIGDEGRPLLRPGVAARVRF